MINVKNHQIPPTIRVDKALGISSEPGSIVIGDIRSRKSLKRFLKRERLRVSVGED